MPQGKITKTYFYHFSTKTYVLGTQKTGLSETVRSFENPKHMLELTDKKKKSFMIKMFCYLAL